MMAHEYVTCTGPFGGRTQICKTTNNLHTSIVHILAMIKHIAE